ncbi:NAD(P)/FAD-dependent oxidoreductase [Marimonas arenosa]|uniref:FAD-binding oxidoreductase n=1 Tax=Marimonas arenosa TaxID=1795305 RepID=A0AAE3WF96_9RHOB|nr:FAD-dependent oxidoreductase [Marimonas arenosa]MDQ2091305.1 FAD-binding oxidoreductase [Marimonas arenosa]
MRVVIIGAGIIGASVAWHLSRRGVRATVVEAGPVAGAASGRGFGWINASFHLDSDHFRLRLAAMGAWRRLASELPEGVVEWPGCLWWEAQGTALESFQDDLKALGYPVEIVSKEGFRTLEPGVADPPEQALRFADEGAVDLGRAVRALLAKAGVRVIAGVAVRRIEETAGRVTGVALEAGRIPADAVVVAAGIGAPGLVTPFGVTLPMLSRPGLLLRTRPVAPVVRHILSSPRQELRQDNAGQIWAPTSASHQCDETETVVDRPDALADQALSRIRRMLPGIPLDWAEVVLAQRPVPGDGRPVMGPAGPEGLYLAVMHSGATLGALAGEMIAGCVMGDDVKGLARWRLERFGQGEAG